MDKIINSFCDAVSYEPDFLTSKGYFIRDAFYMVNPYKYLDPKWGKTLPQGVIYHDTMFITLEGRVLASASSPDEFTLQAKELEEIEWQVEMTSPFLGKGTFKRKLDEETICNIFIGLFQRIEDNGVIRAKLDDDTTVEFTTVGKCQNNTQVFRGLYRAQKQDDGTYKLTRIFDRFYFNGNVLLEDAIQNCLNELNNLRSNKELNFPYPICWFGDLQSAKACGKPIILTLGINPSANEFNGGYVNRHAQINPQSLMQVYNGYFNDPFEFFYEWQRNLDKGAERQGKHLNASYCESYASELEQPKHTKYQLIHIDLFPYASQPAWNGLDKKNKKNKESKERKKVKDDIRKYNESALSLLKLIISYCNPELIISFGGDSEKKRQLKGLYQCIEPYGSCGDRKYEEGKLFGVNTILSTDFPYSKSNPNKNRLKHMGAIVKLATKLVPDFIV